MEWVDVLALPDFHQTGQVKTKKQALVDSDWLGVLNLWLVTDTPVPALIYQQRSPQSRWGPNLLDVTVGGYYQAGESLRDGLREAREEIGQTYTLDQVTILGKKLFFGTDTRGNHMKSVVDVCMLKEITPLEKFALQTDEVYALFFCPLDELIKLHTLPNYSFTANGINNQKKPITLSVDLSLIPANWDNYHYKIALLAHRFLAGEKQLIY